MPTLNTILDKVMVIFTAKVDFPTFTKAIALILFTPGIFLQLLR